MSGMLMSTIRSRLARTTVQSVNSLLPKYNFVCIITSVLQIFQCQTRNLNLLEYQSKALLQESDVAIQAFRVLGGKKDQAVLNDFRELNPQFISPKARP